MNVLVYDGPGVSQTSLSQTISSLKALLYPNYSVNPVKASELISAPWPPSCALLVIPGGRDLPYVSSLAQANPRIKDFVSNGGSFLAFCAGAYYASKRVEWEVGTTLEVIGDRELGFFPGTAKGCVYDGFLYESEGGAKAINVEVANTSGEGAKIYSGIYYNGGGHFDGAEDMTSKGVRVLAKYVDGDAKGKAAAVSCDVGQGRAILWGPHLEYPLVQHPAAAVISKMSPLPADSSVDEMEMDRWQLLKETLILLGLRCPQRASDQPSVSANPLPQIFISPQGKEAIVSDIMASLIFDLPGTNGSPVIQDANDEFHIHRSHRLSEVLEEERQRPVNTSTTNPIRHIIVLDGENRPGEEDVPLFNIDGFFAHLSSTRKDLGLEPTEKRSGLEWGIGEALLYGEVVTSTQTLFDKNPQLMRMLPPPVLSIASQQLTGRGRGGNTWLSPLGCLQFSILLRPPQSLPAASLVFIQYLFGIAVVEACRRVMPGKPGEKIRLKWPNDIYAVIQGDNGEERKKLGGILVTTNFSDGRVDVVVGCGINVSNPLPTTSLSQIQSVKEPPLTLEKVAGAIMPIFEKMWHEFVTNNGSFKPFVDLYLDRWLHSDQLVTLTTTEPHQTVRIVGITTDYGLLRTVPVRAGLPSRGEEYIDLQPDGNSFDMMAGLIRLKR